MYRILTLLVLTVALTICAKAQTGRRLIAQAAYQRYGGPDSALEKSDSARYTYSSTRRSRYNSNDLTYSIRGWSGFHGQDLATTNNIDSSIAENVEFDSAYLYTNSRLTYGVRIYNHLTAFRNYNNNGENINEHYIARDIFNMISRQDAAIHWYSSGKLVEIHTAVQNPLVSYWDSLSRRYISYNGAGKISIDSHVTRYGGPGYSYIKAQHGYGTSGGYEIRTRLTGPASTTIYDQTFYDYYSDGKAKTRAFWPQKTSSSLYLSTLDSFGYTAGVSGHTYHWHRWWDHLNNLIASTITIAYHANLNGQKDSGLIYNAASGTPVLSGAYSVKYDVDGNPLRKNIYAFDSSGTQYLASYEVYHYEPISPLYIREMASSAALRISPNPCQGVLRFSSGDISIGSRLNVRVSNVNGQLVHSEQVMWQKQGASIQLPTSISQGLYLVHVYNDKGQRLLSEAVQKE